MEELSLNHDHEKCTRKLKFEKGLYFKISKTLMLVNILWIFCEFSSLELARSGQKCIEMPWWPFDTVSVCEMRKRSPTCWCVKGIQKRCTGFGSWHFQIRNILVECVNSIKFIPYEPSRIFRLSCVFGHCNPSPNPTTWCGAAGRLSQSVGFPIKDLRGRVSTKWWGSGNFASKPYNVWAMVMLKCCVWAGRNVNRDDQNVLRCFEMFSFVSCM